MRSAARVTTSTGPVPGAEERTLRTGPRPGTLHISTPALGMQVVWRVLRSCRGIRIILHGEGQIGNMSKGQVRSTTVAAPVDPLKKVRVSQPALYREARLASGQGGFSAYRVLPCLSWSVSGPKARVQYRKQTNGKGVGLLGVLEFGFCAS